MRNAFLLNLFLFPVAEFWVPCSNTGINLPIHNLLYPYLKKKGYLQLFELFQTDHEYHCCLYIQLYSASRSQDNSPQQVLLHSIIKLTFLPLHLLFCVIFPQQFIFTDSGILTFWIVYEYKLFFCCLPSFINLKMSNRKDLQVDSCRILHRTFIHCDIFFLFFVCYLKELLTQEDYFLTFVTMWLHEETGCHGRVCLDCMAQSSHAH